MKGEKGERRMTPWGRSKVMGCLTRTGWWRVWVKEWGWGRKWRWLRGKGCHLGSQFPWEFEGRWVFHLERRQGTNLMLGTRTLCHLKWGSWLA